MRPQHHKAFLAPRTALAASAWLASSLLIGAAAAAEPFVEVGKASGIDFVHFNGMSGEMYFVEVVGSGAALFDYDNDGDLDLYLVQGHMLGADKTVDDAVFPPRHPLPLIDRLYRNDTPRGEPDAALKFTDVTETSGIVSPGYGMGVAAGDIDNDGWVDLYITNFGSNQLFVNRGNGTFADITAEAGVDDSRWSTSAAFVDFDRDGWLDLYVGNYVNYSLTNNKPCRSTNSRRDYCGPNSYVPETDRLFRNTGDGKFVDVTAKAGINKATGGALGVVAADFNGDQWIDIYVANDGVPIQLWINQADGSFVDDSLLAGVSVNGSGMPEASMGVDAADFDGDGDEDLFMTHLVRETNTLYVNDGSGWFEDATVEMSLAQPTLAMTGFGTAWFDYDNDGRLDILSVNGAVQRIEKQIVAGDPLPLKQHNQLFLNIGNGGYREVTAAAGPAFAIAEVSRGAAFGDVDNDGDTDVVITNNAGPARLLRNQAGSRQAWLGVKLTDAEGKRDVFGARAAILDASAGPLWRRVRTDGSYASANDPRILFGLGARTRDATVTVLWPDGNREIWPELELGRYHLLARGQGQVLTSALGEEEPGQ